MTQLDQAMPQTEPEPDRASLLKRELRELALDVQHAARRVDTLWLDSLDDGAVSMRIVDASHALHRASLALGGDSCIS